MIRIILLLTLVLVLTGIVFAQMYKWVDKEGNISYGDRPPTDCKPEEIKSAPCPSEIEVQRSQEKTQKLLIEQQRRKERSLHESEEKRLEYKAGLRQEELCFETRRQLAVLQELHLPAYRDESRTFRAKWKYDTYQGDREYLDNTRRNQEIERLRQEIMKTCQNPNDVNAQDLARRQWIRSERCAAARAELEFHEQPSVRAGSQTLDELRQEVEKYCLEPDSGDNDTLEK